MSAVGNRLGDRWKDDRNVSMWQDPERTRLSGVSTSGHGVIVEKFITRNFAGFITGFVVGSLFSALVFTLFFLTYRNGV